LHHEKHRSLVDTARMRTDEVERKSRMPITTDTMIGQMFRTTTPVEMGYIH
jgi:hypothetical protein